MKSPLLPVIVGLSLCSASAALIYVWLKTKDNGGNRKKGNKTADATKLTTINISLTSEQVPLVIGRGNRNLQAIEEESNAKITFHAKDDSSFTCEITGLYENVLKAEKLIRQDSKRSATITAEIFIPQAAYIAIVGRGGKVLREICRKSNAQVHIDSGAGGQDKPEDKRRVMITGSRQSVDVAKSMIQDEIKEAIKEQDNESKRGPRASPRNQLHKSMEEIDVQPSAVTPNEIKGFLKVYVSASASIDKFWVQLYGPQSKELDQLVNEMSQYYNNEENQEIHRIADPFLGQIVTTRFNGDSKWYRAQVVGILPNEYNPRDVVLDVFFVDYGDSQYVNPNEVYGLHMDYLTLRFQAIECFLANVKPLNPTDDGSWDSAAIDRFDELTFGEYSYLSHSKFNDSTTISILMFPLNSCPMEAIDSPSGDDQSKTDRFVYQPRRIVHHRYLFI